MITERGIYDATMLFGIGAAGYGLLLSNIDQVTDADLKDRRKRLYQAETVVTLLVLAFGWLLAQARGNGAPLIAGALVSAFFIGVFEWVSAKPETWM